MLSVILFYIYLVSTVLGEDCCKNLIVGGVSYTYKGEENTTPFNCKDSCTYYKTDDPDTKFCFSTSGDLKSQCEVSPSSKLPISMSSSVTSKPGMSSNAPSSPVSSGAASADTTSSCKCGIKKSSARVIGGQNADVNEYPWMASLQNIEGGHFCGGAVVSQHWVATAAHCVRNSTDFTITDVSTIKVVLGEHSLQSTTESTKDFKVEQIVINPSELQVEVDLALIKVKETIDLNTYTPICLPPADLEVRGKNVTLSGWGLTQCSGGEDCPTFAEADILQEITALVASEEVCRTAINDVLNNFKTTHQLCWGGEEGRSGCFGDSGSGIIYFDGQKYLLVGSVSAGTGSSACGAAGNYGLTNDIPKFVSWYKSTIGTDKTCQ